MDVLQFLLAKESRLVETKEIAHTRWSKEAGTEAALTVKALDYDTLSEIRELHPVDMHAYLVLEGVVSPNLKDPGLRETYDCETAVDVVKKILLPGEIDGIASQISRLSGYGVGILKEIKKNRGRPRTHHDVHAVS